MVSIDRKPPGAHLSVLAQELVSGIVSDPEGLYLDATYGAGGHSKAVLAKLAPEGRLFAIDRDPQVIAAGARHLQCDSRLALRQGLFSQLLEFCQAWRIEGRLSGLFADLGMSSMQLDQAERGFSFRPECDGPVDMRMTPGQGASAAEILAALSQPELEHVLRDYGGEPHAARIARALVERRKHKPFTRTADLARSISSASGFRSRARRHPATRSFQALRILVNNELGELRGLLAVAGRLLKKPGGRLAIITFHSLEARIFKEFLRAKQPMASFVKIGRTIKPSFDERRSNPRSRSATLRLAETVV